MPGHDLEPWTGAAADGALCAALGLGTAEPGLPLSAAWRPMLVFFVSSWFPYCGRNPAPLGNHGKPFAGIYRGIIRVS